MPAARFSSARASASAAGHMGLNANHCSGASRTMASSESAIAWVARSTSAGEESATSIGAWCEAR